MTPSQTTPLTELERDALGELSNIAMARAANSLRQMVEHEVLLSVPTVDILSREQATEVVHIGLMAMMMNATAELFNRACFNYPTLGDLYKYAAYDAILQKHKPRSI